MESKHEETIRKLEQNDTSLTLLDMRQKNLTSQESRAIFEALEKNTVVSKLQYLGNNSSGEAAKALGRMLKSNHTIEELELGTNELNNEDLIYIVDGMKENTSVIILDLNSNVFDISSPVADLLEHSIFLKEIDLTNSNIDEDGFLEIYKGLLKNESSTLTAFNVFFPPLSCIKDFENICNENASRHGSGFRL